MDEEKEHLIEESKEGIRRAEYAKQPIPFSLLNKRTNKTTKLHVNSGAVRPIEGTIRPHVFELRQPYMIFRFLVRTTGYEDGKVFEVEWEDEGGKPHRSKREVKNGWIVLPINDVCQKITFRPPVKWFVSRTIDEVRIEGISKSELPMALAELSKIEKLKKDALEAIESAHEAADEIIEEADDAETRKSQLEAEIQERQGRLGELNAEISTLRDQKSNLNQENATAEDSLAKVQDRVSDKKSENTRLRDQNSELRGKIETKEAELAELEANINLFPSELTDFVKQGAHNITLYSGFILIPILLILLMFGLLIDGAADLTTVITEDQDINIMALILSRVPYALISIAIITASYKIASSFIGEIVKINNQRLNLNKISIIAKDVSNASSVGLGLSPEERYRLRATLKMELLKDHMKSYLSEDFKLTLPKIGFDQLQKSEPRSEETVELDPSGNLAADLDNASTESQISDEN